MGCWTVRGENVRKVRKTEAHSSIPGEIVFRVLHANVEAGTDFDYCNGSAQNATIGVRVWAKLPNGQKIPLRPTTAQQFEDLGYRRVHEV